MRVIEMNVSKQLLNVVYTIHCFQKRDDVNHTSIGGTEARTSIVSACPRWPNSRQTAPECKGRINQKRWWQCPHI